MQAPVITVHRQVIDLIKLFSYLGDDEGVCFGLAAMGMQAGMHDNEKRRKSNVNEEAKLSEIDKFNQRITFIKQFMDLKKAYKLSNDVSHPELHRYGKIYIVQDEITKVETQVHVNDIRPIYSRASI